MRHKTSPATDGPATDGPASDVSKDFQILISYVYLPVKTTT